MMYYPEFFYKPETLNMEELTKRFNENAMVSFTALDWDEKKNAIITEFKDGILGYIPEAEICNERQKYIEGFSYSTQAHSLLGKTACALITNISGNEVKLSRKKLQQEAIKNFLRCRNFETKANIFGNKKSLFLIYTLSFFIIVDN